MTKRVPFKIPGFLLLITGTCVLLYFYPALLNQHAPIPLRLPDNPSLREIPMSLGQYPDTVLKDPHQATPSNLLHKPLYIWKKDDILRFDYFKSTTITQPGEMGVVEERQRKVAGVLILEVREITAAGAKGILRIDSPRVELPAVKFFSSQFDQPRIDEGKDRVLAKTIEGAIKKAKWDVLLERDGMVRLTGRVPANLRSWLEDTENAAGMRKKSLDLLPEIIEQDLGLGVPSRDNNLFLCQESRPGATNAAESFRLPRTNIRLISSDQEKARFAFERKLSKPPASALLVPGLAGFENNSVEMLYKNVATREGKAIFDIQMGMLDTLAEDYTVTLAYRYGNEELTQSIHVQYHLTRLAPPISKP